MSNWYDKYYNGRKQAYEPESSWWRNQSREALQAELRKLRAQLDQRNPRPGISCTACGTLIPKAHTYGCPLGSVAPDGWIACCIEKAREDLGLPADGNP